MVSNWRGSELSSRIEWFIESSTIILFIMIDLGYRTGGRDPIANMTIPDPVGLPTGGKLKKNKKHHKKHNEHND